MNKYLILTISLLISANTMAQTNKNTIKTGPLATSTPYVQFEGIGAMIQYDRYLKGPWGVSMVVSGLYSSYDRNTIPAYEAPQRGTSPDHINRIENKELFLISDFLGTYTYRFFQKKRLMLAAGAGLSILHSRLETRIIMGDGSHTEYDYPGYIYIEDDKLQTVNDEISRQPTVLKASLALEMEFKVTEVLSVGFKGAYRSAFKEQKVLMQRVQSNSHFIRTGTLSSRGIERNTSLSLVLGFMF